MIELRIDSASYDRLASASREDDIFSIYSHSPDEGMQQIQEALTGRHDLIRERLIDRLSMQDPLLPLTRIEAALFAHHGVDPLAVAAIMIHNDNTLLLLPEQEDDDDATCFALVDKAYIQQGHIMLAPGFYWRFKGSIEMRLPETIRTALQPGPLSAVLTHPVLDPLDLQITNVEDWHDEDLIEDLMVNLKVDQKPLSLTDLVEHRPRVR